MSEDDIIAMAVSCGGGITGPDARPCFGTVEELLAFAHLAAAHGAAEERNAIEKICEEFGAWNKTASEILDALYERAKLPKVTA